MAKFILFSRSIIKGYILLEDFKFNDFDSIIKKAKSIDFIHMKGTFAVRCERSGTHDFGSQDIERGAGEIIFKKYKIKANLDDPDTTVIVDIIEDYCLIGIDFSGEKLSKREYRIRTIPNPINPCLAYSLIRIADFNPKKSLLDPFCKSGEITIESALFSLGMPNCEKNKDKLLFNKFLKVDIKFKIKDKDLKIIAVDSFQNNVRSTELNSKIAGINKNIRFSRMDVDWLDTKFKEKSIDMIITVPPIPTASNPIKDIEKLYKEFFYNSEFILKKGGTMTLATPIPELIEKYSSEFKFKKLKEMKIKYQTAEWTILVFSL